MENQGVIRENIFPDKRLFEIMPDDTQVAFVGEFHEDLFHRLYFYMNLPDFAANGFDFACEISAEAQACSFRFIDHLGYRPDQMQRYEHIDYSKRNAVLPADVAGIDNYNIFKHANLSPASSFKVVSAARRLGMGRHFIDNPEALDHESADSAFMTARNDYMAEKIVALARQGKKILVWCGHHHLYSAPKLGQAEHSLQQLVSQAGIKTYASALLYDTESLLLKSKEDASAGDIIKSIDPFTAEVLQDFHEQYELDEARKVFPINLKTITAKAGKELPDQLLVFPDFTQEYIAEQFIGNFYYKNPVLEDHLWMELWRTFSPPARQLYKQQRRNIA